MSPSRIHAGLYFSAWKLKINAKAVVFYFSLIDFFFWSNFSLIDWNGCFFSFFGAKNGHSYGPTNTITGMPDAGAMVEAIAP